VFKEKVSGAKTDRAELAKVIRRLEPGDVLVVTRLDRLARSTRDLLNVLAAIAERKAGFRSLKDAWADTTTPHGRLMLTVLGGLAEFERELIRARTGEGRKRAKDRGVRFGRPAALTMRRLTVRAPPTRSRQLPIRPLYGQLLLSPGSTAFDA
jgi:DNA invertase Pin-like site-specific DNA recombinase